jgi:hypothetical protein
VQQRFLRGLYEPLKYEMWETGVARYQLMLPEQSNPDSSGATQDLTFMLPHFLKGLSQLGFSDSSIQRGIEGTWTDPQTGETFIEPMTRVDIDAIDSPENDHKLRGFAAEAARVTGQHKLYFAKHPLPRMLVDPASDRHPSFDMPGMDDTEASEIFT